MARAHRELVAGAYYHVSAVGNCGTFLFREDDDRRFFLHLLRRVARRYLWRLHAYCLMGTPYHVIVETPQPT